MQVTCVGQNEKACAAGEQCNSPVLFRDSIAPAPSLMSMAEVAKEPTGWENLRSAVLAS